MTVCESIILKMKWIYFITLILQLSKVCTLEKLEPPKVKLYLGGQTQFKCSPKIPTSNIIVGVDWEIKGYHKVQNFATRKHSYEAKLWIPLHIDGGKIQGLVSSSVGQHKSYPRFYFHKKGKTFTMLIQAAKLEDAGEIACVVYVQNYITNKTSTIKSTGQLSVLPGETPILWGKKGKEAIIPCKVPNYLPYDWMTSWIRLYFYNTDTERETIFTISNTWRFYRKSWEHMDSAKYEFVEEESSYIFDVKIKKLAPADAGYYECNVQIEKIHPMFKDSESDKEYYFPVQLKIKGAPAEKKCMCSRPKYMLGHIGDTLFTNALNCGSRVKWRCRNQVEPVYEEPLPYQTCVNRKWEPEFEGLPWCVFYETENACKEYDNRKLCKQGSECTVDRVTSEATCGPCKPYTTGVFCEKQSDEYCNIPCNHGNCTYHTIGKTFTCVCHDGWLGYGCNTNIDAVCEAHDKISSGGTFCKNGGTCLVKYKDFHVKAMCQCPENTTGQQCETLLIQE